MHSYFALTLCLVVYINGAYSEAPANCASYECPTYKVLKKADTYEIRQYDSYAFAGVSTKGDDYKLSFYHAYTKLQQYFEGANDQKKVIPKTLPIIKMFPAEGEFRMNFYIPKNLYAKIPVPDDKSIRVYAGADEMFIVRSFDGFSTLKNINMNQKILREELAKLELPHVEPGYATSFNAGGDIDGRYNEVMYSIYSL